VGFPAEIAGILPVNTGQYEPLKKTKKVHPRPPAMKSASQHVFGTPSFDKLRLWRAFPVHARRAKAEVVQI